MVSTEAVVTTADTHGPQGGWRQEHTHEKTQGAISLVQGEPQTGSQEERLRNRLRGSQVETSTAGGVVGRRPGT